MAYPYKPTFFAKYPEYIPPTSEEDALVDPREKLKPPCIEKCAKFTKLYDVTTFFTFIILFNLINWSSSIFNCLLFHICILFSVN